MTSTIGVPLRKPKPISTPATNCTSNIQGPWDFPGALLYKPVREYGRFACLTDRFLLLSEGVKIGPLGAASGRLCGPLSYCHRSVWQSRTNGHGAGKNHPATFLCIHPNSRPGPVFTHFPAFVLWNIANQPCAINFCDCQKSRIFAIAVTAQIWHYRTFLLENLLYHTLLPKIMVFLAEIIIIFT